MCSLAHVCAAGLQSQDPVATEAWCLEDAHENTGSGSFEVKLMKQKASILALIQFLNVTRAGSDTAFCYCWLASVHDAGDAMVVQI